MMKPDHLPTGPTHLSNFTCCAGPTERIRSMPRAETDESSGQVQTYGPDVDLALVKIEESVEQDFWARTPETGRVPPAGWLAGAASVGPDRTGPGARCDRDRDASYGRDRSEGHRRTEESTSQVRR